MCFRVGYYVLIQFGLIAPGDHALIEILKTIYYGSVALLIIVMSFIGHKSIKENEENPE